MENFSLVLMGVFSVAADDLMREYNAAVELLWGQITSQGGIVLRTIQSELPLPGQISKAGKGRPAGTDHAPGPNWSENGALRASFHKTDKTPMGVGWATHRPYRVTFESDKNYVYYYANGNYHPSYHGYDFIGAAKRRLPVNWL